MWSAFVIGVVFVVFFKNMYDYVYGILPVSVQGLEFGVDVITSLILTSIFIGISGFVCIWLNSKSIGSKDDWEGRYLRVSGELVFSSSIAFVSAVFFFVNDYYFLIVFFVVSLSFSIVTLVNLVYRLCKKESKCTK
jgi:hypothetical protein